MLGLFKNIFKLERKPQKVETGVYRNPDTDQFIITYGHQEGSPTNVGSGNTLQEALKNTAEIISKPEKQQSTVRKQLLKDVEETSLNLHLYYNEVEENYTLAITDHEETEFIGRGRNTSSSFKDLAENVKVE